MDKSVALLQRWGLAIIPLKYTRLKNHPLFVDNYKNRGNILKPAVIAMFKAYWVRNELLSVILTFLVNFFSCLLLRHHVMTAAGFEPEDLHSMSYVRSADTKRSFVIMCTATGFTTIE